MMRFFRGLLGFDQRPAQQIPVCTWKFASGDGYLAICPNCGRAGDKHEREMDPSAPTVPGVNWLAGEKYKAKR